MRPARRSSAAIQNRGESRAQVCGKPDRAPLIKSADVLCGSGDAWRKAGGVSRSSLESKSRRIKGSPCRDCAEIAADLSVESKLFGAEGPCKTSQQCVWAAAYFEWTAVLSVWCAQAATRGAVLVNSPHSPAAGIPHLRSFIPFKGILKCEGKTSGFAMMGDAGVDGPSALLECIWLGTSEATGRPLCNPSVSCSVSVERGGSQGGRCGARHRGAVRTACFTELNGAGEDGGSGGTFGSG
ncbi:hypothetical protein OH77DRAFT_1076279 [Trametes cingulata]|nr:hypothetical protein OH77DRAFT_1076279 [Trametes cingulata]